MGILQDAGGSKGVSFAAGGSQFNDVQVGSTVTLKVTGEVYQVDQTDPNDGGKVVCWPSGDPKKQFVLPVEVVADTTGENEVGSDRAVYFKKNRHPGSMFQGIGQGEAALGRDLRPGDSIWVKFLGRVQDPAAKGAKEFEVRVKAGEGALAQAVRDDKPAPVQQAPRQAPNDGWDKVNAQASSNDTLRGEAPPF